MQAKRKKKLSHNIRFFSITNKFKKPFWEKKANVNTFKIRGIISYLPVTFKKCKPALKMRVFTR